MEPRHKNHVRQDEPQLVHDAFQRLHQVRDNPPLKQNACYLRSMYLLPESYYDVVADFRRIIRVGGNPSGSAARV